MPRQPILALGLMAAVLAFGFGASPRAAAAADEAQKPAAPASAEHAPAAPAEHAAAGAAAGHAEGGHGEKKPDILEAQPTLALWTVVVFLGLLFVLGKFAWKPLMAALHQREEHLEHVLLETERARNESEQLLAEHRRQLAAAEAQIRSMIDEAKRNTQTLTDDMLRKAGEEAEATKKRAEHDITTAKDQALSEIFGKTADLAVNVAGRVLGRTLGEDDHRRLIDAAVGELKTTANGHKGART